MFNPLTNTKMAILKYFITASKNIQFTRLAIEGLPRQFGEIPCNPTFIQQKLDELDLSGSSRNERNSFRRILENIDERKCYQGQTYIIFAGNSFNVRLDGHLTIVQFWNWAIFFEMDDVTFSPNPKLHTFRNVPNPENPSLGFVVDIS